jgi:hypothetical protein
MVPMVPIGRWVLVISSECNVTASAVGVRVRRCTWDRDKGGGYL